MRFAYFIFWSKSRYTILCDGQGDEISEARSDRQRNRITKEFVRRERHRLWERAVDWVHVFL
jgi:hypothetical protein